MVIVLGAAAVFNFDWDFPLGSRAQSLMGM